MSALTIDAPTAREVSGTHWLNRKEAARYLGIGYQTLCNHRADGPKHSKFFGSVRYRLVDLDAWARQQVVSR